MGIFFGLVARIFNRRTAALSEQELIQPPVTAAPAQPPGPPTQDNPDIAAPLATPAWMTPPRTRDIEVHDGWVQLTRPKFFGRSYTSPNKRWIVACGEANGVAFGGSGEHRNGRVVLIDLQSNRVCHEVASLARPMAAAVSDVGRYIVRDGTFGSALEGDVIAIGTDGQEHYRRKYLANIYNVGLSPCGRFSAVQTAHSPSIDGNKLEILDLDQGCIVFSVQPASGWADAYSFEIDDLGRLLSIGVEHRKLGYFRYSASGTFLDGQALEAARLENGDFSAKLMTARALLKSGVHPDRAQAALMAADEALALGAGTYPHWGAQAHRIRGEAYEELGQHRKALAAYNKALAIDAKIGVRRRVTALRKKIDAADI